MAIIANDKNKVKEFVRINYINSNSSLPDFELAEERYLLPILGNDLYELVKDLAAADPIVEPTAEQAQNEELVRRCQAVVVPLAYLMELPSIHTQLTDAGLRTVSTDTLQAAHRWEYNEMKEHLADKGAYAIESLLRFLFLHADYYTEWTESNEYQEAVQLIFPTGEAFSKYFPLHQPHRQFWELKSLIKEVQDLYIHSTIGEEFFTELKDKAAPTDTEKRAIELIKKAVAQFTIVKAIEKLSVRKTEKGFTVLISAGDKDASNSGDAPAKDTALTTLYDSCEKSGNSYLMQLTELLNNNASAAVFATYYGSDYYEAPPTEEPESRNANRKIFGL